jgi:hypothetical protein
LELPPLATEATRCVPPRFVSLQTSTHLRRACVRGSRSDGGAAARDAADLEALAVRPRTLGSLERRAGHMLRVREVCVRGLWRMVPSLSVSLTIMAGKFTDSQSNSSRKFADPAASELKKTGRVVSL